MKLPDKHSALSQQNGLNEFSVPPGFFDHQLLQILAKVDTESDEDSAFFQHQQKEILLRVHTSTTQAEWVVPGDYFHTLHDNVGKKLNRVAINESRKNTRVFYLSALSAAAAVVLAWWFLSGNEPNPTPSFTSLAEELVLEEKDLEWVAEGDEIYDYFLEDALLVYSDTLKKDTLHVVPIKPSKHNRKLPAQKPASTPPSPQKKTVPASRVNWDELETDDILYYLIENKGDDDDL